MCVCACQRVARFQYFGNRYIRKGVSANHLLLLYKDLFKFATSELYFICYALQSAYSVSCTQFSSITVFYTQYPSITVSCTQYPSMTVSCTQTHYLAHSILQQQYPSHSERQYTTHDPRLGSCRLISVQPLIG